ncbi:MAG: hypothetical protein ACRDN9_16030 [Streptosporangiaceae bacterium]
MRYATKEAVDGWQELCGQVPHNVRRAWEQITRDPTPRVQGPRHHRLMGDLAVRDYRGRGLEQWQYEVTGAGRLWYLVGQERRVLWLWLATTGHPRQTG